MISQFRWTSGYRTGKKKCFQVVEEWGIILGEERDSCSVLASTTSTTNTMGIIFNRLGHVVIDDQRYILDVDTSTSYVCSYQNILGS